MNMNTCRMAILLFFFSINALMHSQSFSIKESFELGEPVNLMVSNILGKIKISVTKFAEVNGVGFIEPIEIYSNEYVIQDDSLLGFPINTVGQYELLCFYNNKIERYDFTILPPTIELILPDTLEANHNFSYSLVLTNNGYIPLKKLKFVIKTECIQLGQDTFKIDLLKPSEAKKIVFGAKAIESGVINILGDLGEWGVIEKTYNLDVKSKRNLTCYFDNKTEYSLLGVDDSINVIIKNSGDYNFENLALSFNSDNKIKLFNSTLAVKVLKVGERKEFIIRFKPKATGISELRCDLVASSNLITSTSTLISIVEKTSQLKLSLNNVKPENNFIKLTLRLDCEKFKTIKLDFFYDHNVIELMNINDSYELHTRSNIEEIDLSLKIKNESVIEEGNILGVQAIYTNDIAIRDYLLINYLDVINKH